MKSILKYFLVITIVFLSNTEILFAQKSNETAVKSVLTNILDLSKSKVYEKAAALIAYDGEDKNRNQKESFNPANKDELNQVKRICKKISALLDLSSKHEFGQFSTNSSSGKDVYTIEVSFVSGDQKLVTSFSFIKTEKGYLLSNMN